MGLFWLTVKRDTQKERATKSRNSWGAEAVRVRATGSLRAHPPEVLGHNFSLGFLVNSETRHTEGARSEQPIFRTFKFTVKRARRGSE